MRPFLVPATVLLIALVGDAGARAQSTGTSPVITQSKLPLTAEDRYIIKEVVVKDQPGKTPPQELTLDVGAAVPQGVQTQQFPEVVLDKVPKVRPYTYLVKNGEVIVVDPKESRVVEVIR